MGPQQNLVQPFLRSRRRQTLHTCIALQEWSKVPKLDFPVIASTDEASVVWRERDTANPVSMASKTLDEVTGLNVPNADYAIPTTSSDEPPIM